MSSENLKELELKCKLIELQNEQLEKKIKLETLKNIQPDVIEKLNIYKYVSKKEILKCLNMSSITGDLRLFKKVYLSTIKTKITFKNFKTLKYKTKNKEIEDNGLELAKLILNSFENCYRKENILNNIEEFTSRQNHLNKMRSLKYQLLFIHNITQLLR